MAIVRTLSGLQATTRRGFATPTMTASPSSSLAAYASTAYATIYATQPNVRICVDFLARNIAQLGFHIFRRVSDTDRVRLIDHELALWLEKPNPATTRYRLFESFIADLAVYFNAFWLKVRITDPTRRIGLVRMPPETVQVQGGLLPSGVVWTYDGQAVPLDMTELVYANGYNPLNPLVGLSPLETLRRVLAEDLASSDHRARYWENASRMEGVIERPPTAPKWTPTQKQSWREQWQARYSGPQSTGQTPVLEDGMTFRQISYSARDSEYVAARQLTREECARAYHIPLPMVGILDHATFSNIKEQHKQLYADCLGPWLEMVREAVALWLLPEARDTEDVYGEFNIAAKLAGSFEEQANAIRVLVGRPIMTANEGRGRLNLPSIKDDPSADQLAAQQGGPATSTGMVPVAPAEDGLAVADVHEEAARPIVRAHLARQASRVLRYPPAARADALDVPRSLAELAADLTPVLGVDAARAYAARITDQTYTLLVEGADAFGTDRGGHMPRKPHTYDHLAAFALEHPWAVTPQMLTIVAGTLARRMAGMDADEEAIARAHEARDSRDVTVRGGGLVAVIPIMGVIAPRMNLLSEMSGGTTFEALTKQLQAAVADPEVKTIVFDVDSPGGNVAGASEFAREVLRARATKPIIVQAHHLLASAAYWAMAGATEIVATPSAHVGSIGVFAMHDDLTEAFAQIGLKREVIAAGKYKAEALQGSALSDEARGHLQHLIDGSYNRMVGDIAKGRGVSAADVRNGYGEGRALTAEDALAAGLIDRIATCDDTLARVTQPATAGRVRVAAAAPPVITADPAPAQESRALPVDATLFEFERRVLALESRRLHP